ncbi:uncharacterized protein DNG_01168 [Cephalotrichum gorgonifer]|uniref:LPXTG-domain-containing protein n=1 Tax=Cephalotrichum gorgonifer TaxID=2041049 RepID=A0AAE8MQ11_9PEZI|nr:uncharacterized protein DNG_01168 [Cephalotrichum gorgonifer]
MRLPRILVAAGLGLHASSVVALRVSPGSPCASKCGNVLDSTSSDELVCDESAYSSGNGLVFKNCVNCEMGSTYFTTSDEFKNKKDSDLQWAIYNMRYATSYCVFGFPDGHVDSSPCITSTACEPFMNAVTFGNLATNVSTYDYCAGWNPTLVGKCLSCLRPTGAHFISNFLTVLTAACEQQPLPGKTVGIEGNVFSLDVVNMTDASAVPTLDPSYFDEGSFGLAAKVGVAFGALGFVLVVAGFSIVCIGKRRRRAYLRQMEGTNEHKSWAGQLAVGSRGQPSETPLSQRPLRGGWDDSPMSAATEKMSPARYFSPYSSQFGSPVSAVDAPSMPWPEVGPSRERSIGIALGGESPQMPEPPSPAKGKARAFDGVDVYGGSVGPSWGESSRGAPTRGEPPVLGHPGHGRSSSSLPRRYTLTEEDARNGNAI